ncbi:MAG: hypothetical protein SOT81_03390 [Treponema sp.]|nr:hypothetical protein [Treponema sp.]
MSKKSVIAFIIFLLNTFAFSQIKNDVLDFTLGESKDSVQQTIISKKYTQTGNDNSNNIFPISLLYITKQNLIFNGISVEHITLSFLYDKLFCISIVTSPSEDLELLTNSRRIIKKQYNLDKYDNIAINEEFYDKHSNPSFYSCNDNQDFILVIYGKETYQGKVPQCYNFLYKSKAEEAVELKNAYQKYSDINYYTEMTLEELQQKSLIMEKEKKEKQRKFENQRIEEAQKKKIAEAKQREEYNKKHRFDEYMGGMTGCWLGGGMINGNQQKGGFAGFDGSLKIAGPLSVGADCRFSWGIKTPLLDDSVRIDLDAYLSLGIALPMINKSNILIYTAVVPGFFIYEIPENSSYSDKRKMETDNYIDIKAGVVFTK